MLSHSVRWWAAVYLSFDLLPTFALDYCQMLPMMMTSAPKGNAHLQWLRKEVGTWKGTIWRPSTSWDPRWCALEAFSNSRTINTFSHVNPRNSEKIRVDKKCFHCTLTFAWTAHAVIVCFMTRAVKLLADSLSVISALLAALRLPSLAVLKMHLFSLFTLYRSLVIARHLYWYVHCPFDCCW